jgi:WD40 repeat protein
MDEPNEELRRKMREGARQEDYAQQRDVPPPKEAFEPILETASPQHGSYAGGRRNAMPEAIVRPSQPARQAADTTPTPWLPPGLGTLLPRLVLPAALLAIPIAAAFASQAWLARTHIAYDANLLLADGGVDEVTALQWSPADGALFIGTRSGSAKKMSADGAIDEILSPRDIDVTDGEATSPVQSFHSLQAQWPIVVYQDRVNTAVAGPADAFAATQITPGLFSFEGGLFASVEANNGSAVVGRATTAGRAQTVGQPGSLEPSSNNVFDAKQPPPQQVQQQVQTGEQLKGAIAPPEQLQVNQRATASGPARFGIALRSDLQGSTATVVGEISGIEDVRAVAALPGTDTVIAGDGEGNVFAIDASQQIGASSEAYIRGIGQHEAAIVEIEVAAQPGNDGVLFATRAEDRTIKVWRGSVSRASQLIPLGDYRYADVTTPGSTWVREPLTDQAVWRRLLSMSSDGRFILGATDNNRLRLIQVNTEGEAEFASDTLDIHREPAVLSPDGSYFLAVNRTDSSVYLVPNPLSPLPPDVTWTSTTAVRFSGLPADIATLSHSRNSRSFITLSGIDTVSIQNVTTPDQAITFRFQFAGTAAAISPDGSMVAGSDMSGRIIIHSGEDGSELTSFQGPQNLGQLVFDDSGKRVRASTTDTLRIHTYSLRNLRSTTYDSGLPADAGREGFIPNGNRYFSRNGNAGFRITDIDSGATVGTLQAATGATDWVSNLDGSRIATLGGRGNISLFREEESPTTNGPMPVMADNAMRLSADGRTLVVGGRGGELHLARLDGEAGQAGYRLRRLALPAPALHYEIAPDGASIATAEADGTVTISDLAFGSSVPGTPANQIQTAGAEPEPTPAPAVTIAETIEISGHGAPLTAIALSPDGERLATASLDGRLRVTSIAWARLVHRLPLAALPSGPERAKLEPQPLDDSPYALMSGQSTSGGLGEDQSLGGPFIIVYNASKSLGQAIEARDRAAAAGFPDGLIFRRQGFFRGVFSFTTTAARDEAMPRIRQAFSGAYARELPAWCPSLSQNEDFIDCGAVAAGNAPPPAAAN